MSQGPAPAVLRNRDEEMLARMRQVATGLYMVANTGSFDGIETPRSRAYIDRCRRVDRPTGTILLFTRDVGHHSSGWLKNPDYERCWHLSLSFRDPATGLTREFDWPLARLWAQAVFGDGLRYAWVESPKTDRGQYRQVHHWRVFCDRWWTPLLPRGEVYSKELTEIGWKSASEVAELRGILVESPVDPS